MGQCWDHKPSQANHLAYRYVTPLRSSLRWRSSGSCMVEVDHHVASHPKEDPLAHWFNTVFITVPAESGIVVGGGGPSQAVDHPMASRAKVHHLVHNLDTVEYKCHLVGGHNM